MNGLWQEEQQQHDDDHARLRYDDVVAAGPPARPLDFPAPTVHRANFVEMSARDHRSGTIHHLKRVLVRAQSSCAASNGNTRHPDTAYLVTRKLAKSVYGTVKLCIVLKRIDDRSHMKEDRQDDENNDLISSSDQAVQWESTDYLVAIKFSEWKKIHHLRGKHLEDPIKECAALQLLGNYHPHVLGALEILQDDSCLYTVMPYLGGGDVYGRLLEYVGYRSTGALGGKGTSGFAESLARAWFRQLLLVSLRAV
jgi:serine/threonine protein kinase